MVHGGNGYLVEHTKVTITSQGLSFSIDGSENPHQLGQGSILLPQGEKVILQTVNCKICVNGYYMIDESIQRVGYFEFKGFVVSFFSLSQKGCYICSNQYSEDFETEFCGHACSRTCPSPKPCPSDFLKSSF